VNKNSVNKILKAHSLIVEDILSNNSFDEEDLKVIQKKMGDLITQLNFWEKECNGERFLYELKCHLNWILENYS